MSFLASLSYEDLQRLRQVVRRVHMRYYPARHQTTREADKIIESLGPRVAEKLLKQHVDAKLIT